MSAVIVNAQKIAKNEIDKFTGDVNIESKAERLWRKGGRSVYLKWFATNGIPFVVAYYYNNYDLLSVDKGDELYINFMDGTQTILISATNNIGDGSYSMYGNSYSLGILYAIMPEQIEMLQKRVIKAFRLYHDGGYVEGDVNPERALIIREMFKLLDTETMLSEEFLEITGDVEVPDVKAPETGK